MGRMTIVAAVGVAAIAAVGAWMVLGQDGTKPDDVAAAAKTGSNAVDEPAAKPVQWRPKLSALKGDLGVLPDASNEALKAAALAAKDAAGLKSWFDGHVAADRLVPLSPTRARRHGVRAAAELLEDLGKPRPRPAHDVEVAWLAAAMLGAQGKKPVFVTDGAALATPLLLSRTRVGVQSGAVVIAPLKPIKEPKKVTEAQVAAWWLIQKAYVKRANKSYGDAHKLLALAREIAPGEHATEFARGVIELDQGLIDRGIERCSGALAKQDDPIARVFLADVLNQLERPFKAWQQIDAALRAHPNLPEAHAGKGLIEASRVATLPEAKKAAKLDEAAAALQRALQLDPNVAGARAGLAQVLMLRNDVEGAERLLVEGVDNHRDAACADILAKLWSTAEKAPQLLEKLQPLAAQGDPRIIIAIVKAHATMGAPAAGLEVAEKAYADAPENDDLALLRADLLRQAGKPNEAIAALDALRNKGADKDVSLLLAQLLLQNKKTERAIGLLEPIVRAERTNPQSAVLLIIAYKQANKLSEANELIDRVQQRGLMTADQVAGTLIELGDADGAVSVLEKVMDTGRPSRESAVLLTMIYTASNRRADAEKLRDKLVKAAGEQGEAWKKALNEAIDGAATELKQMREEDAEAARTAPPKEGQ